MGGRREASTVWMLLALMWHWMMWMMSPEPPYAKKIGIAAAVFVSVAVVNHLFWRVVVGGIANALG